MSVSPATLIASLVVAVACMTALLLPAETINNLKNNLPQHPSFLYEQYKGAFSSGGSLGDGKQKNQPLVMNRACRGLY